MQDELVLPDPEQGMIHENAKNTIITSSDHVIKTRLTVTLKSIMGKRENIVCLSGTERKIRIQTTVFPIIMETEMEKLLGKLFQ